MAKGERLRLPEFGGLVAEARRRQSPPLLQSELARKMVEAAGIGGTVNYDQSFIAKLEKGDVTNPSKEFLEALCASLGINFGEMLGAIVADKYLSKGRQQIASLLRKGILTLPELAAWEGGDHHTEIWITAEQFHDPDMPQLQDAVEKVLSRENGTAVFFLNKENAFKFRSFHAGMSDRLNVDLSKKLLLVELEPEQSAVLVAPFVIANPTTAEREGYIILSDDRGPNVAIRMSATEAHRRMDSLRPLKDAHLRSITKSASLISAPEVKK